MRANLILLAPIVCFGIGACAERAAAQTAPYYPSYQQPAWNWNPGPYYPQPVPTNPGQPAQQEPDWGPARSHPHDYPGPPLRGGGGGQ